MRLPPAFQFYAGDFLTGTTLMSNAEVGLYIRLLCLQAEHGSIPDDVERLVRAFGVDARKLWAQVRSKFVAGPQEGTLVNERMVEVLGQRDAFRLRQSEKGKLSAEKRLNHGKRSVKPRLNPGSTVVEPLGVGVSITQEGKDGFDAFYASYPNKKAKAAALVAWAKLKADERALCKPAIEAQTKAQHFQGQDGKDYIPHPASWLNARRWEDEIASNSTSTHAAPVAMGWNTPTGR